MVKYSPGLGNISPNNRMCSASPPSGLTKKSSFFSGVELISSFFHQPGISLAYVPDSREDRLEGRVIG
jgi:hypothetical protein